jgi:hypothetical protein
VTAWQLVEGVWGSRLSRSLARSPSHSLSLDGRYKGTDVVASRRGLLRQEIWIFLFYVRTTSLWSEKVKDKSFRPLLQKRAEIQNISISFMCPAEIVTTVTTIYWAIPSLSLFLSLRMCVCMHAVYMYEKINRRGTHNLPLLFFYPCVPPTAL